MSDQVFISYSHDDTYFVRDLKREIEADGTYEVWIDAGLPGGEAWPEQIDEEIRKSFAMIVVMSPESHASLYVTYEWAYAIGRKIPILPILYKKTDKKHPKLATLQYVDCSSVGKEPWDKVIEELHKLKDKYLTEDNARFVIQYMELGREQQAKHNYNNAITHYQEVLRFASPALKDDIHYEIAVCHIRLRQYDKAADELESALNYNPEHTQSLVRKAELLRREADQIQDLNSFKRKSLLSDASATFEKALEYDKRALDENGESIWGSLGGIYKRQDRPEEAMEAYKKAVAIRLSSYPLNNLGLLYLDQDDLEEMRRYFKQVENFALNKIKVNPNDAWAYNDLFVSQVVMEKIPEAEETLDLLDLISGLGQSYAIDALIQTMEKIQNLSGLEPDVRDFATQSIGKLKHSANGAS